MVLKKEGLSRADFAKRINDIEEKLGDTKTSTQNITNYLNNTDGEHNIGWKMALKMEKALGLPEDTLVKMVKSPIMAGSKRDFNNMKKKVREL
jgi:transcriptional regulator with XRE-family HTH domain